MGLSKKQIDKLSEDLESQGITFNPLKDELLDHLICDIETRMTAGDDFETAWITVRNDIPNNHFKYLQIETMEILSKKVNLPRLFAIVSISLLSLGTLFKILHLAGAGVLLLAFLVMASLTLFAGSYRSITIYRESKGRGVIFLATILVVTFISGLCFRLLQLPWSSELLHFSVIGLCILLPALSIYFYSSEKKLKDNLLIRLIEENQNVLEKTALVLIGFGFIFNYSSILLGEVSFAGVIFFIFSIIFTGMYLYISTWRFYVKDENYGKQVKLLLLIFSSLAFVMFMLPVLVESLSPVFRNWMAYLSLALLTLIVLVNYLWFSRSERKKEISIVSSILLLYPFLRLGNKLEWFDGFLAGISSNTTFIIGFLIFLIILFIRYRKEHLFKALIIIIMASYMIP